ncbi:hypothetical protein [Patulibacter minatonensis]|uniref:hypothetical protein n=1 Tax=Patulibacter minatonensis TaxID=298163 RepID=UPI00047A8AF1|nr:hypothetical protein [Patulibacter minatonensis]
MSTADDLRARARALHDEGILSADGLDRFVKALENDEATPSEYMAFLDHIETRRTQAPPADAPAG